MPRRISPPSGSLRFLCGSLLTLTLAGSSAFCEEPSTPAAAPAQAKGAGAGNVPPGEAKGPGSGDASPGTAKPSPSADSVRTGQALGSILGALGGGMIGAVSGLPGGTAIGAVAGSVAGSALGGALGGWFSGQAGAAKGGDATDGAGAGEAKGPGAAVQSAVNAASPAAQEQAARGAEQAAQGTEQIGQGAANGSAEGVRQGAENLAQGMAAFGQAVPGAMKPFGDMVGQFSAAALNNPGPQNGQGASPASQQAMARAMEGFARVFPDNPAVQQSYAQSLIAAGDYPAAVEAAQRAVELDPASSQGHSTLARAQYHSGDYPGARESAREALRFDPHNAYAGSVLRLTDGRAGPGDGSGADPVRSAAAGVGSRAGSSSFGSLGASRTIPRYPGSRGSYAEGADSPLRLIQNAQRMLRHGDSAGALKAAESALRLDPSNDTARYYMIMALTQQKRLDEALKAADAALAGSPKDTRFLSARCRIYNLLGRHAEALADAEAALRLRPDDVEALVGKAWALDALGRRAEALAALAAAAALDPKYRDLSARAPSMKPGELAQALARETEAPAAWEQAFPQKPPPERGRFPIGAVLTVVGAGLALAGFVSQARSRSR